MAAVAAVKARRRCVGIGGVVRAVERPLCVLVGESRRGGVSLVLMLLGVWARACVASEGRSAQRESGWQ